MTALAATAEDERQQWRLPVRLFEELHRQYRFTRDCAALAWNTQLQSFWSPEDGGLVRLRDPANDDERGYLNQPFDYIDPWAEALHRRVLRGGFAVQVLPVRPYCPWFFERVRGAEHHFFTGRDKQGRVNFEPAPGVKPSSNREPVMLAVYDPITWGRGVVRYRDAVTGAVLA